MSYRSQHLNKMVSVVRGNTSVLNMQGLTKMLAGVSFKGAKRLMVSNHEYGNTKHPDSWLVFCYFKAGFIANQASMLAGYAVHTTWKGVRIGGNGFNKRMARMNTSDVFSLARCFIKAGHITKEDLRKILVPKGRRQRKAARGSLYKFWAKELVASAVKKQGSNEKAAKAFGVSAEVIDDWLDVQVSRPI